MAKPDNETYTRLVVEHEHLGIVLNPEILQLYKQVDGALPALIVRAIDDQLKREYTYALGGQIVAALALILMAGGFVFLVMNGHEKPAYFLLGAGVLNVIGGFLRARLSSAGERRQAKNKRLDTAE